jgi:MEMO1 family protein
MLENERPKRIKLMLFDSTTLPIPPLRRDVQVIPVEDNGRSLLVFYDPMKVSTPGFALDRSVEPVLSLIDGQKSLDQLIPYFGDGVSAKELLKFIQMLDEQNLLDSEKFRKHSDLIETKFEEAEIRPPALAGSSYPADKNEAESFLRDIMQKSNGSSVSESPGKALYAPHIDLRVGAQQYAEAFSSLKKIKPSRVVILATAHYSGYYPDVYDGFPFIGSEKDYELPGRILKADRRIVQELARKGDETGFTTRDRAHRIEHSIETHLLFANHIWKHNFSIVPVLVAGLDEIFYKPDGDTGRKIEQFSNHIRQLDTEDTFYLISGDLSHVGRKFGDTQPAGMMRKVVENFDRQFIETASENDPHQLLGHIGENYDAYRVCGFPPLFTFLKAFPGHKGIRLNYHWWDEKERESAVSFGSILY